ncbi:MAG: hypothetical protein Kow0059_16430 [Candidatus Sumerlaeia bacterium]
MAPEKTVRHTDPLPPGEAGEKLADSRHEQADYSDVRQEQGVQYYKTPTKEERARFKRALARHTPELGRILEDHGLVSQEMIRDLIRTDAEAGTTLKKQLVQQGLVREDDILDALASEMGMEKVNLAEVEKTEDLLAQIDPKIARKYMVFPVAYDDTSITVAIADPLNIQVTDDLEKILGKQVKGVIASEDEIERLIKRYYEGSEVERLYDEMQQDLHEKEGTYDKYTEIDLEQTNIEAQPVVRFVDLIFKHAVHERASDIHIEPMRGGITIRFRIDGVLHEIPSPPKSYQNAIISRLKVMSGMDLAKKRIPQDGRIKLNLGDKKLDLRVSSLPAVYGESIVMRILDASAMLLGLDEVGFLEDNIRLFKELIQYPNGVILMTGPTGSGKTTTLYAALNTLNSPEVKIVTIENPVEYMLDGINQVQVNEEAGLDFALGLRSILRQSPDVILVGEIRDQETAEIAVRAALTGHLVFSTLHTNDAPSANIRLIDMGIKPFLVASSIQAVIAQRLLRRICSACKTTYKPHREELIEIGVDPDEVGDIEVSRGTGCERCGQLGYRGRTAIHEIFLMRPELRQMVIRLESASRLKRIAVNKGMRTLRMDGWEKVKRGITSIEEVLRVTQEDEM